MMAFLVRMWLIVFFAVLSGPAPAHAGPSILVDIESGEVLAEEQSGDPWYPASITKLMTLYVAAQAIRDGRLSLTSRVRMSEKAAQVEPSKMGFAPGTEVTMENAFAMLIVKSANDIAVAIAERVAGSQAAFVVEMNNTARRIGMSDSQFTNPHGLPSKDQYVSARDMALLGVAIHKQFPELLSLFKISQIQFGEKRLHSYNLLLEHYRGASGMKTGYTCASGLNMVASAERGSKHYLAVILGEHSGIDRAEKAALLLESGFRGVHREGLGRIDRFKPRPSRTTPVNLSSVVCGGEKIRAYQIVVPPAKPKAGSSADREYVSPQRKDFGPGLGDPGHPQGTLVRGGRGVYYRSHILQPYQAGDVVRVTTGASSGPSEFSFTVRGDKGVEKRFANDARADVALPADHPAGQTVAPDETATLPVTASAFANAHLSRDIKNGAPLSSGQSHPSRLVESALLNTAGARKTAGQPLLLRPLAPIAGTATGVTLPRPNPVR